MGAQGVALDVLDAPAVAQVVADVRPGAIVHLATDLPDDLVELSRGAGATSRIRRQGTAHLLRAAASCGCAAVVAQSCAFTVPGEGGEALADLERQVLDAGGVVARYGRLSGAGTWYPDGPEGEGPWIAVEEAARRTVPLLFMAGTIVEIIDPGPAVVTVFRSRLRPDARDHGYGELATAMAARARTMPGLLDVRTFESPDGERCTVVRFDSWEHHRAWRDDPEHRVAQERGRVEYYESFEITVGEVVAQRRFERTD